MNRWWKRRSIIVPVYILYLTILFGGVGKVYLWLRCGVPLAQIAVTVPTHSVYFSGIGASGVLDADESHFNVVLLGASTAGQLAAGLNEELIRIHGNNLRFYNLTNLAHTSRDSLYKFRMIAHKKLDLVLVYDGFNELRFNYTPSFKADYSHVDRYSEISKRDMGGRVFATDFSRLFGTTCPSNDLRPELLQYGSTIKTDVSLRDNLEEIAATCRGQLVLITFAYHMPVDYEQQRLLGVEIYTRGEFNMSPDHWGRTEDIPRIMDAHNAVIRELAQRRHVTLVDLQRDLPATRENFSDACHLSPAGIAAAVRIISPVFRKG